MTELPPTVVLLLSDKRSGSTMFQDELCRHPAVQHVAYSPHTYSETHHWLKAAVLLDRPAPLFVGNRVYGNYGSAANARTYMIDTLARNIPGYVAPQDDAALVFEGWEALCARFARPVFFEKSPQILVQWAALSLLLEWKARTRFRVRLIGLVRNPLAVQYSAQALFSSEAESRQFSWLMGQRNLLTLKSMLPAEDFLLLRYEDIIADPRGRFDAVCDFVGLPRDGTVGSGAHAESLEKWRDDPEYTLQLDPAVRQIAEVFGYTAAELDNPHKPAAAPAGAHTRGPRPWRQRADGLANRVLRPAYLRLRARLGPRA